MKNELRRMAYLDALGVDCYVSRKQLPGAATTQRWMIVPAPAAAAPADTHQTTNRRASQQRITALEVATRATAGASVALASQSQGAVAVAPATDAPMPRFSLTAMVVGDWLWLEELDGMPLTMEQLHLVQAMAVALQRAQIRAARPAVAAPVQKPEITQFDWPIHTNDQLDLGTDAARASLAAFLGRKLEQSGCYGLVLLGQRCASRVPPALLNTRMVTTASSAEILRQPALKAQVWCDLKTLLGG